MNAWEEDGDFLARWLSDELSPAEKAEFENSAEGKAYARMVQAADRLVPPPYQVNHELNKLKERIEAAAPPVQTKTFSIKPVWRYAIAACFTAILVTAYFVLQSPLTKVNTAAGQQELVVLPDGSEVTMNGGSALSYNAKTWEKRRAVDISGEAFFQVSKGSSFVVNTTLGKVAVLGTSFNVRTRHNKLEVVCYTGKVNVSSTHINLDLLPGDGVRVEKGDIVSSWDDTTRKEPSWLNGLTLFEQEVPLSEALEELQNVFDINVTGVQPADTTMYRGAFPHSNAASAIDAVLGTLKITYEFDSVSNTLRITGLNP
jgi:ferric-dicitrate binding protein FerR (iron transport regulator)